MLLRFQVRQGSCRVWSTIRLVATPLLAAAALTAHARPACERPLSLGLHEHGLLYSAQTGQGIDRDIADEMARRSGCRFNVAVMQRARIWQLIEGGALDFSLSGISNEARERFAAFAWYDSNKYYLLVRRDAGVRTVDDFAGQSALRLGVIRSFRYGPSANRMVDALDGARRVSYATSLEPLYQLLLDGGIQAMIIEPFDYPAVEAGRLHEQTQIVEFDDAPVPHGLIMSRKSLPASELESWRALIDEMRADGTIRRIFEKYFPADLASQMTRF
jgi:polar amino acid transport system substrate-binding protein